MITIPNDILIVIVKIELKMKKCRGCMVKGVVHHAAVEWMSWIGTGTQKPGVKCTPSDPPLTLLVFLWDSQGVGESVMLSALWGMWRACLFHWSWSHLRNARTWRISSSRSSASSVYHIRHVRERHHSTCRAVVCTQLLHIWQYEQVHTFVSCLICTTPHGHHAHVHGPDPWWVLPPLWISHQCLWQPTDIFSLEVT